MNVSEALDYIHGLRWMSKKLGLTKTEDLLSRLGNPEKDLKYIHVGGTNGKGSTSAMLAEILRESGLRVGLFTSPFIMNFNERIMISTDDEKKTGTLPGFMEIPDEDLARITGQVKAVISGMEEPPSEFEAVTVIGFLFFKEMKCDIVILEVGMGGEFDATNVIPAPEVTILTNIGLDHMQYLGSTVSEIATTKSKIIKPGSSVVFYGNSDDALPVIRERCAETGDELSVPDFSRILVKKADLSGQIFSYDDFKDIELNLIGNYMQKNCAVVLEAVKSLKKKGYKLTDEDVKNGLLKTGWIARLERLADHPSVFVDGSHNPQGMRATIDTIKNSVDIRNPASPNIICIFGVMADKDVSGILEIMDEVATEIICVQPVYPRAMEYKTLTELAKAKCPHAKVSEGGTVPEGIEKGLGKCTGRDILLCLGSLYMAGEVRNYFLKK